MTGFLSRLWGRRKPGPGAIPVHINDPDFDHWSVVSDYQDIKTARAWCHALHEAEIEAVLTSDWPLDRFERGDIALRVPRDRWSEADELLSGYDDQRL